MINDKRIIQSKKIGHKERLWVELKQGDKIMTKAIIGDWLRIQIWINLNIMPELITIQASLFEEQK